MIPQARRLACGLGHSLRVAPGTLSPYNEVMAAPATTAELLDLIRKSGVVDEKRLDAYLRKSGALPAEPPKVAGLLVRDGLLTHFQAEQIMQGKWRRFTIG